MSDQYLVGLDLGQRKDYSAVVAARKRMVDAAGELPPDATQYPTIFAKPADTTVTIAHGKQQGERVGPPARLRSQYATTCVQRFPLETDYPSIVERTAVLFTRDGYRGSTLVVDQTGVGAPVVDQFRRAKREPVRCAKCRGDGVAYFAQVRQMDRPACLTCGGEGKLLLQTNVAAIHITNGTGWRYEKETDTWYVSKRELISVLVVLMEDPVGRFIIDPRLPHANLLASELTMFRVKKNERTGNDTLEAWREREHDDLVLAAALMLWYGERASRKAWFKC
ncbi:MAG: zinc finger-like domain-containing protein [Patescibacteria group bacterium]|nr:zinc finger-like domain-containing protein [Patescibacteria group bacterium]